MIKKRLLSALAVTMMICGITVIPHNYSYHKIVNAATYEATDTVLNHTQEEAVAWAKSKLGWEKDIDNGGTCECVDFTNAYFMFLQDKAESAVNWYYGHAYEYATQAPPKGFTKIYSNPKPGDVFVQDKAAAKNDWGHVGIVIGVSGNELTTMEANYARTIIGNRKTRSRPFTYKGVQYRLYTNNITCYFRPNFKDSVPNGTVMTKSAGQTIPDGDYWICSALDKNYFMDVEGNEVLSGKVNVSGHLWSENMPGQYDVFTVKYKEDGFYEISQKDSEFCLDVTGASLNRGVNIQMSKRNNTNAQRWSVRASDSGYTIQSKCNSWYADISGAAVVSGTNIQCWTENTSKAQRWLLIPYQSEPGYSDGIYQIYSGVNENFVLDAEGTALNGDYENQTNIQITDSSPDDCFVLEYESEGYYRIKERTTGLYLDVSNAEDSDFSKTKVNVQLNDGNKSRGQLWAVQKLSDNTYIVVSKLNGYCLDISADSFADGVNVQEYYYNDSEAQKWTFKAAKANGDANADGVVSAADVVVLKNWLLGAPDSTLADRKAVDLNEDGIIDTFDLILLRRLVHERGIDSSEEWISESELPVGAVVVDEKWTYDIADIETTTSDIPLEGWDLINTDLEKTSTETYTYVNYPAGFDTTNSIYAKYNKSSLKATEDDTTKREISESSVKSYIYWHWNYLLGTSGPLNDRFVSETSGKKTVSTGQSYTFSHFSAFESSTNLTTSDSSGNCFKYDTGNYADVSWWWFKLPVYQQTYTDYKKIYTYSRGNVLEEGLESDTDPSNIENSANIQRLVIYIK